MGPFKSAMGHVMEAVYRQQRNHSLSSGLQATRVVRGNYVASATFALDFGCGIGNVKVTLSVTSTMCQELGVLGGSATAKGHMW